jgi:hypothetical protein
MSNAMSKVELVKVTNEEDVRNTDWVVLQIKNIPALNQN